jgi:hypothetical protein
MSMSILSNGKGRITFSLLLSSEKGEEEKGGSRFAGPHAAVHVDTSRCVLWDCERVRALA